MTDTPSGLGGARDLGLFVSGEEKREIEDQVADGNAQRKFTGASVTGKPDDACSFLLGRRDRTSRQGQRIRGILVAKQSSSRKLQAKCWPI